MKIKKTDFSKFKKTGDNATHATFSHPDGHHMIINKADLEPEHKAALARLPIVKMADGGPVQPVADGDATQADGTPGWAKYVGDGQMYNGTDVVNDPNTPTPTDQSGANRAPASFLGDLGDKISHGWQDIKDHFNDIHDPARVEMLNNQGPFKVAGGIAPQAQPSSDPSNFVDAGPAQRAPKSATPSMGSDPFGYGAYSSNIKSGLSNMKSGIQNYANAQGKLGADESVALQDHSDAMKRDQAEYFSNRENLLKERSKFQSDLENGHIDPKQFWNSKTEGGKVSTAIGLILGGIGGGMLHQDNPVLKFLNSQIDRNIESQKMEMGKKQNLLSANMQMLGNLDDAERMTRVNLQDSLMTQLKQAAAKNQSPMAQAMAQQLSGKADIDTAGTLQQIQQSQAMMKMLGQAGKGGDMDQYLNALRMVAPERAKEIETRYVPGVGTASVPVNEDVRSKILARNELQDNIGRLRDFAAKNSGSLDPKIINYGKALSSQVQDAYRRGNNQGVFKPAESEFVKGIISDDPTAFFNSFRTDPGYRALQDSNLNELNALHRSVGLPTRAGVQSNAKVPKGYKK